jgi:hypothetical protein
VDNIKTDLREIELDGMDWVDVAVDRTSREGSCKQGNELSGSIKYWEVLQ